MIDESKPGVDGLTFGRALARTVERLPDRDALVFPGSGLRLSYARFREEVERTARALLALGIQAGDHIGIWAPNVPEWVFIQFAAAQVGAVLVNINPAYRANELAYVLKQADITTLVLVDEFKRCGFFGMLAEVCPEVEQGRSSSWQSQAFPKLRHLISTNEASRPGICPWPQFLSLGDPVPREDLLKRESEIQPDDVVNIQYTSGTTGFPKGAMLSHRNLLMNAYYIGLRQGFTDRDRLCIPVPFYHCFGCVLGTLACIVHGVAMVIPAESFDALATLQAIEGESCTALYGVPTMFIAELHHPRFAEFDLSSLRTGIMAGSPCPIELMRAVVERMGAQQMTIGYGLTEASPLITQTDVADSLERRVSTVGRALPDVEVRICAPGSDQPLPPGQPGELQACGHGIMKGYYNKPKETAEAITSDGWLHSGDLALETPDGYYRITGRLKDMIIRGGENVYPREIEEFLFTHPAVADVQVVGLPDAKYGEEISAWIRFKPQTSATETEIRAFCKDRLAHYKVPRYIIFVDEYPTTVTGKIQKFKLRELGIERFGLQQAARIETA
jgi:fatty-acyl-CoA synthase